MSDKHKPMTDEELDAIKGRLAAITEWPWIAFCRTGVRLIGKRDIAAMLGTSPGVAASILEE